MIGSVLIANRGEIACRIIRTARAMGIRTVAVFSEADVQALHVRQADEAVAIGPAPAKESYLRGDKIIAAAKETGAEAIHPGYGFLSENADFAQAVLDAGLVWIGPPPSAIRAMGLKDAAKKLMAEAGVPVTPGYLGEDQSEARLQKEADAIGYPVLIKAVAGGGGKGMRKVESAKEFKAALAAAKREAASSFGDDRVLLETYVQRPRHIEVQVFGDEHGDVVHMFERDCSLQRRHQKVIEEAPAPGMDEATRAAVYGAAVRAAKAVDYVGAGTVEFIADASAGLRADRIWFMEMNTRLQVEHPVTEEITGLDLVEWQFRVASGEKLPKTQDEIAINGHAIEARLYAENPETGFLPSIGKLECFSWPPEVRAGTRIETGVEEGDEISPHYDPMIAKLVAHGPTRARAIASLRTACAATEIAPLRTNAGFLARCLAQTVFEAGNVDTGFIESRGEALARKLAPDEGLLSLAANAVSVFSWREQKGLSAPWRDQRGFRLNAPPQRAVRFRIDGAPAIGLISDTPPPFPTLQGRNSTVIFRGGDAYIVEADLSAGAASDDGVTEDSIRSPMPGKIVSVAAKAGASVKKGDPILTLEAMKMEHVLTAPFDGVVAELKAKAGDQVSEGVVLARLEKA